MLDDEIISAPYIDFQQNPDGIDAANGSEISGGFTIQTAQNLANLLKTGALPIKLELISSSQVSATLGKQALAPGPDRGPRRACCSSRSSCSSIYRVLGVVAVGALGVYSLFMFAMVKLIPITLTLPGIAGLILTIGVAADANIVIFERVKEEIRAGRSVPVAISQGYRKGLTAIVDANVVTFMVAFILFILATAGVKGFAFALGVGTLVSFLTAVLLTQAVLGALGRSRIITHPAALGAQSTRQRFRWDYMGALEVLLRAVRRDPADRRALDRRQGPEPRHRLHVRARASSPSSTRRRASRRSATRSRRSGWARRRSRRSAARSSRATRRSRSRPTR